MPIIASAKSGGSFEPVSEGVHIANCISIIDLGDQYSEKYDKTQRKVLLTWEVTDETIEIDGEEKPRVISNEYTLSLSEKANLRTHLEAWRGKNFTQEELDGFDLQNVLGKPCQLSIVHNERNGSVYANIKSIMSIPKGMPTPPVVSELTYFALDDAASLSLIDKLPQWIQDKIKQSPTYKQLVNSTLDSDSGDFQEIEDSEDLPF